MPSISTQLNDRTKSKIKKTAKKAAMGTIKAVFLIGFCFVIIYPVLMMISKAFMERRDIFDNTVRYS